MPAMRTSSARRSTAHAGSEPAWIVSRVGSVVGERQGGAVGNQVAGAVRRGPREAPVVRTSIAPALGGPGAVMSPAQRREAGRLCGQGARMS